MKSILLALFCMAGFGLQAQVSSYVPTGTGVGQTYTAIVTPAATGVFGTNVAATLDNAVSGAIPLGFNFNFNGKVYTTCYISFNGFITFGSAPAAAAAGAPTGDWTPISAPINNYEGVIAAYAKDLKGAGVDVLRQTQGAVGNRTFTVQWTAYRSTIANTPINMQIILHESDPANVTDPGVIDIKYNISGTNATQTVAQTGQVGLRGENNTDFNNKNYTVSGAWATASPVFARGTLNTQTVTTRFAAACITAVTRLTWTPPTCFAPRTARATPVLISYDSATITWVAPNPVPANGYQYLVTTTAPNNINMTYPVAGTVATGTVGAGVLTTPVSALTANTLYYIYVRSDCGGLSGWSAAGSFTTLCTPYAPLPYTQNFESGFVIPAIPPCNKVEDLTGEVAPLGRWVTNTAIPSPGPYGFLTRHAQCTTGGSFDNNTTYFIEGIQLTGGVSYRLSYKYGASNEFPTTEQSMSVRMYSAPYVAATSTSLADHPTVKDGPFTNVINFVPASTGVYYIGFNDYSLAGNATLLLDDIDLRESTCIAPTALNAGALTGTSATINWTAPVLAPGSGYNYYVSTSSTPPTGSTTPTGSVGAGTVIANLASLTPATTYYFWVRSNCGSGDYSGWSVMGTFTTASVPSVTYCTPAGTGSQDPNGITNVTMGTINNNTGIEPGNYGNYSNLSTTVYQGAVVPVSITYRTGFTYETKIWVDWNNDGDFVDAGEEVASGVSLGTNPATLNLSFTVPGAAILGQHRLRIGGIDDGVIFPPALTPCRTGPYMAFEDYSIFVTTAPPALTLSATPPPICSGDSVPVTITSVLSNYNVYSWSPNGGISGTAPNYTFTPTSTNTYVLTGFNTTTFQTTTVSITITVNQPPTPITITPASATVCQGQVAQQLTASGGIVSGVSIYSENFNGTAPGWTTTNATSGGNPASADWVLAPDGYFPFITALHSNDNSQFAFTESDAPGIGTTTATTLTSPPINLTGYTTASLSFWQFYNYFNGPEGGTVQIANNIAGPWTTLQVYGNTGDLGTETNWVNSVLDLTPYTTYATAYVRFKYDATWDWGWGIDNFVISGSATTSITWSPVTGLYTTAAATPGTEYVAGTGALTVYALPSTTTVYTASAQSGLGCTTSTNATITVTPISGGTMPVTSQTVCGGGAAADIVITTGTVVGSVLYWQYASDAAFTVGVTNIPGTAGLTTLPSATIGTLTATRYYRAVISVGGCANAYSQVHTITVPSTTYNGSVWSNGLPNINTQVIFTGNYTMTANMSACSVDVQAGTVTVNSGVTFTVQNAVTINAAANLIFQDDASLLQVNSAVPNSGDMIYRRITTPMRIYDYTYWSSPVNAQILSKVSLGTLADKYFWFNTGTYQWTSVAAPGSTTMTVGRGYIIRAPQSFTATPQPFSTFFGYDGVVHGGGTPNNGNIVVSVGRNSPTQDLDCIGNPYPSAISANLFISDVSNTAALGSGTTLYFWTHNTPITALQYTQDDYASWNYSGGVGTGSPAASAGCPTCNNLAPNGNIAAGQSFMVKVAASGNVTFKNSMRVAGNNDRFYRMGQGAANNNAVSTEDGMERHRVWLEMKNEQGAYKQALVGYIQNATNNIDPGFDGELVEAGNVIALYSIVDNTKLTIQGRALPFNDTEEIPLGYRSNIAGTFQIAIADLDGLFTTEAVYLEDKLLNVVHDLKQGAYTFTTETGTVNTRFALRFSGSTLAVTNPTFDENAVVVYKDKQTIHVETSNITMKSVKVFDLRGREILTKDNINSSKTEISNLLAAQQVLLVQITSTDNVIVTKKIVY
ncbi:T9SS sorting signal type C domain-containing protein [Flavobacterium sp.]|uniref:T9SS sorting signal type C domain-containing protein n=1 Tax=Flavobacterium sp. TaxID=239 RepID=UPI0039E6F935